MSETRSSRISNPFPHFNLLDLLSPLSVHNPFKSKSNQYKSFHNPLLTPITDSFFHPAPLKFFNTETKDSFNSTAPFNSSSTMAATMLRNCSLPETTMGVCRRESKQFHVLAVDDSNIDRKVIERLLKISSCKVTVVDSGNRALQYLGLDDDQSSDKFDDLKVNLIMTDYSMPGMTGFELLKKIKKSSTFREIPVVIMSSENILTRIDRCLEEGAEDFLLKPVKLSDVERLKDFILKGEGEDDEGVEARKRKLMDDDSLSAASQLPSLVACDLLSGMLPSPASQPVQSLSKRAKL